ncbi:hypothetical protein GN244_ATG07710 [Phytophthora infestans]|uniref:Uncharacterized protein n=1 Tax=Phytophthora infestans TaxID=4787 RepID=A0A833WKX3_PHYIN|nr:hypothetical protein GN244_ATG07710 [Phytophthora infestans]KAF4133872.1 hypothetical protein GN958_ATG17209 [Phytophthora infestans]
MMSPDQPKKRKVCVKGMNERAHARFATTRVDLVTLPDDAQILADVAETVHTLYDEKQTKRKSLLAHVLQSQRSINEDEEYGEAKEKLLDVEVSDNRVTVSLKQHDVPRDFNMLIEYSHESARGVPSAFITLRGETIKPFFSLIFN